MRAIAECDIIFLPARNHGRSGLHVELSGLVSGEAVSEPRSWSVDSSVPAAVPRVGPPVHAVSPD